MMQQENVLVWEGHKTKEHMQAALHDPNTGNKIMVALVYIPPTTYKYAPTKHRGILDHMYKDAIAIGLKTTISHPNLLVDNFNAHIARLICGMPDDTLNKAKKVVL